MNAPSNQDLGKRQRDLNDAWQKTIKYDSNVWLKRKHIDSYNIIYNNTNIIWFVNSYYNITDKNPQWKYCLH